MEMRNIGLQIITNLTATVMFLYQGMINIVSSTKPALTRAYDKVVCSEYAVNRHSRNTRRHQRNIEIRQTVCFNVALIFVVAVVVVHVLAQLFTNDPNSDDTFSPGLCFKCTHSVEPTFVAPQQCHLLDTLKTVELVNHTSLPVDGEQKGCPIETDDDLYSFISRMMESKETVFEQLAHFDAPELMVTDPPKWNDLSKSLQDEFSMDGRAFVHPHWIRSLQNGGKTHWLTHFQWTEQVVNEKIGRVKKGDFSDNKLYGPEPGSQLSTLLSSGRFDDIMSGGQALVIGSQSPWLEAILLAKGMKHVTTAEYGSVNATHPQTEWVHPSILNKAGDEYMNKYDVIASFSSMEHAGLGRYGDPINPSGDLMVAAQLSCLLKPGGLLFFGCPTNIGLDSLEFNGQRIYGALRLKLMFLQFRIVDLAPNPIRVGFTEPYWQYQPWLVLQNKRGCA